MLLGHRAKDIIPQRTRNAVTHFGQYRFSVFGSFPTFYAASDACFSSRFQSVALLEGLTPVTFEDTDQYVAYQDVIPTA